MCILRQSQSHKCLENWAVLYATDTWADALFQPDVLCETKKHLSAKLEIHHSFAIVQLQFRFESPI